MKQIRLLTGRAGARFSQSAGTVLDVGEDIGAAEAKRLVQGKQAEYVDAIETASLAAPERAARTRRAVAR